VWMPVGSMVELGPPARDAVVVGVRLQLLPGDKAVVLVDVDDPEPGSTIPRSFVDRLAKGT
jgi:multidrug efflux pump subunit AcrA (membrane-fusion protein)